MHDVVVIGGGVIGLSLAWMLAKRGQSVRIIDQAELAQEASWAGAGILPAATFRVGDHPFDQLRGLSSELHPRWAAELRQVTGIDTGYRSCGGLYLARMPGEAASLAAWAATLQEEGVRAERLSAADLFELEPGLRPVDGGRRMSLPEVTAQPPLRSAWLLPDEAQLRNPRHLKALLSACERTHVTFSPHTSVLDFCICEGELTQLQTNLGPLAARKFCFTAGAWTGVLLQRLGIEAGIVPIRGQMILFRSQEPPIRRIINEGSRYLVPRDDGYVLAGSTEEEVGFDKRTTDEAIADLGEFARGLVPALHGAAIERTWAGLRPGSFDGLPYLGPLPGIKNAFVAAGHFRNGLFLSPATAEVMCALLCDEEPHIDLSPFCIGR